MASRNWDLIKTLGKDRIMLHGRFSPAGASAPTNVLGAGFTVTRTGVGLFSINLADKYPAFLYGDPDLILATPTNQSAKIIGYVPSPSAGIPSKVNLATWDPSANAGAGGAFDVAANAGNYVVFQLVMNNSTITLGG